MTDQLRKNNLNDDENLKNSQIKSKSDYKNLFDDIPCALWVLDFSDVKLYIDELRNKGVIDFKSYFEKDADFYSTCVSLLNIIDINKAAIRLYEAENKEELLEYLNDTFCKVSLDLFLEGICAIIDGNMPFEGETIIQTLKDNRVDVFYNWFLTSGFEESLTRVFVSLHDISDRKQMEVELRKERDRIQKYLDLVGVVLITLDASGEITLINQKGCQILGYKEQELIGKNWFDNFLPAHLIDEVKSVFQKLIVGEIEPVEFYENPIINRSGEERIIAWHNTVLKGDKGKIIGILSSGEDITEYKQTEEKVRRQIFITNTINEVLKESLTLKTDEEVARMCLEVAEELTNSKFGFIGEINEELLFDDIALSNPGWEACTMEKDKAAKLVKNMKIRGIWGEVLKKEKSLIVNNPTSHPASVGTPEGHPPLTSFLGVPLLHADKTFGMIAVANKEGGYTLDDQRALEALSLVFSEALRNKRAEQNLKQTQDTLLKAQKIAHIGNWDWNIITNELTWSDEIYRIFGLTPQEFGATYEAFLKSVHPNDREFVTKSVNEALTEKKPYNIDHHIVLPDGTERIVHETAEITFDKDDRPIRMLGTVQDITELKLIELELKKHRDNLEELVLERTNELELANKKLQQEIKQRVKAETDLEQFVYAVSHELRTPISVLVQSLENLEGYDEKLSNALKSKLIKTMSRNAALLSELIEDLLLASRIERTEIELHWETYTLSDVLRDVLEQMDPRIRSKGINIEINVNKNIHLLGDLKRIAQIFRIFIDNAIKYSNERSIVKIMAFNNYKGELNPKSIDGVLIQFIDNGIGIRKEDIPNLFKKYFRTKDAINFPGTGLGLSIAATLTHAHKGDIFVESEYSKGTIFSIFLPKLKKPQ
ncbi:MAG: PAS domain S-box protein [Promethearchaeota archaeon]